MNFHISLHIQNPYIHFPAQKAIKLTIIKLDFLNYYSHCTIRTPRKLHTTTHMKRAKPTYSPQSSGTCPHCGYSVLFSHPSSPAFMFGGGFDVKVSTCTIRQSNNTSVDIHVATCPRHECGRIIVSIQEAPSDKPILVWPSHPRLPKIDDSVPNHIKRDYLESYASLHASPRAAAALARRCLESLLNDKNYSGANLFEKINNALDDMPARLRMHVHALRQIGNFAVHEKKHHSGEILDVDKDEAEWMLDLLALAFEHYYEASARDEAILKALQAKLEKRNTSKS